jgi:hypothetical protein
MAFRKYFSLLAVGLSCLVVVATSSISWTLNNGDFDATSDCFEPVVKQAISVNAYQIIAPGGFTYLNLGFPNAVVIPDQDNIGTSGTVTRNCKSTYSNPDEGDWVFTCFDNGLMVCSIYLKKR